MEKGKDLTGYDKGLGRFIIRLSMRRCAMNFAMPKRPCLAADARKSAKSPLRRGEAVRGRLTLTFGKP